jgi:hypothetical protein
MQQVPEGVLFVNTNDEVKSIPSGYIGANGKNTFSQIKAALKEGYKINYVPDTYEEIRNKEVETLIKKLFTAGFTEDNKVYFALDEVHLYTGKEVLNELKRVATGGLRHGINGIWISQRPALIDNTLMTQSQGMIIFRTYMEEQYFDRYRIPYEKMEQLMNKMGDYSYCTWDKKEIKGYPGN